MFNKSLKENNIYIGFIYCQATTSSSGCNQNFGGMGKNLERGGKMDHEMKCRNTMQTGNKRHERLKRFRRKTKKGRYVGFHNQTPKQPFFP